MSDSIKELQEQINKTYTKTFGRTPLKQRLNDISKEATELDRYLDLGSLREEAGDLFTTLVQLFNECNWSIEDLVGENLKKIIKRKNQYKALGRKTQVAILGGAFDPITVGHIQVAQLILNQSQVFDEVYLLPCYQHIYNKKMASPEHRLHMCKLAASVDGRIKAFDYEIMHKLGGETYNLAKKLLEDKKYKDSHSFSFIIGLDNANTFSNWVNYADLERLARFVVVPRTGQKPKRGVNWYLKTPHIYIEPDAPLLEISSTDIREGFTNLKTDDKLFNDPTMAFNFGLNPAVKAYALSNKLY